MTQGSEESKLTGSSMCISMFVEVCYAFMEARERLRFVDLWSFSWSWSQNRRIVLSSGWCGLEVERGVKTKKRLTCMLCQGCIPNHCCTPTNSNKSLIMQNTLPKTTHQQAKLQDV